MKCRWLLLLFLLLPWHAWATSVQASLDRNDVHLGETVTLNLRVNGAMNASAPDLSALNSDFDVLGSSTNSTFALTNGKPRAQLVVGIALRPKHAGDLHIPALTVAGEQTNPLTLHVGPPDTSVGANGNKDVFVEVSPSTNRVYTGQQFLCTVRLFFDVNLNSGSLSDLHIDGADVRKLGDDADYDTQRNGRRYHVVERRYAVTPTQAGTLSIRPIEFQGEADDPGNPNDPGNFFGPGGLFGNTSPVSAASPAITVNVLAMPADWGKTAWLPAQSLTLNLTGLPTNNQVTAGQPLNLRMSIDAKGLPAETLPEPTLPTIAGANVYPDQTNDATHDDGQWLTGHRERSFAVFPQHPGMLTIPAVSLTWFDVQSGQKRVATVPAHTLTVLPVANAASSSSASSNAVAPVSSLPSTTPAVAAPTRTPSATSWRWIAIGSIGLWLVSAGVFWWLYRRRPGAATTTVRADSARGLRLTFLEAAKGRDRAAQARHLLAWARAERPELHNLGDVSASLASEAQRAAIERLQRQQYAGEAVDDGIDLVAVFASGLAWRHERKSDQDSPLPPLYPFKLD